MRVALIVDHPYRDLPGLALIAVRLAQEGVQCYLVPFNLQAGEVWSLAPDFVLLNYLRANNEGFARRLSEAGIRFGVLDTEGGVLANLDSYGQGLAQDQQVRNQAAYYCSWGSMLANHAVCSGWFAPDRVIVTGSPRFDFYARPWREVALRMSAYAANYDRNLVLVNGNFPLPNPRFQSSEAEIQLLVEHFGHDLDAVRERQRTEQKMMHELAALTNRLARRFPQATFVYRPHPFERAETYEGLLEKRDNLHLVKLGTVDGWILRAKAVIQRSCSTAIEAGVAGVPTLLPSWISTAFNMPTAEDVSIQCETEEGLSQTLEAILENSFQTPAYVRQRLDQVIGDWFHRVDGKSHERVAECILGSLQTRAKRTEPSAWQGLSYGLHRRANLLRPATLAFLRRLFNLPSNWSFRRLGVVPGSLPWEQSEKYFDADQVRTLVELLESCSANGAKRPRRRILVGPARKGREGVLGLLPTRSVAVFPG